MKRKVADTPIHYQEKVTAYFQSLSSHWNDLYTSRSVYAETMRTRRAAVLDWIDSLALAPGSQVLEVGCGAGLLAIALAERGLRVQAIDVSEAMVQQARQNAVLAGITDQFKVEIGDISALAFADDSFDLVLAIGVFPWLAQAERAIREMARVTRPEGYVILTAANWTGLPDMLDPQLNPALAPLRQRVRAILARVGFRVGLPEQLRNFFAEGLRCSYELTLPSGLQYFLSGNVQIPMSLWDTTANEIANFRESPGNISRWNFSKVV